MGQSSIMPFAKWRRLNGLPEFQRSHKDPRQLIASKLGASVWSKLPADVRSRPDECWPWQGEVTAMDEFPILGIGARAVPVAVLVWRLMRPETLDGFLVVPRPELQCTGRCVNPWHMERRPKPSS